MVKTESELRELLAELLLRGGDSTYVEVKTAAGGLPESLPESLCAFANMPEGGTVILGVNEPDGFVIDGVSNPAEIEAGIASQARNAIEPSLHIETSTLKIADKFVVVAKVHGLPLMDKPARYRGEAYLRMADGDYRMKSSELRMLEVAKLHAEEAVAYDSHAVEGTSIEDLDQNLLESFLSQVRMKNTRLAVLEKDSEILRALAVTTASGELTLAGLYALGFYPQGRFPSLAVTVAQRLPDGSKSGRVAGLETFEGPVPVLMSNTMHWLQRHVGTVRRYRDDGSMIEVPEFPLSALREAVANALVHRDLGPNTLGVGKAIDVRLLPDKVVITSPGGLRDLTVERLKSEDLARQEVNQRLYSLCRYLRTEDGAQVIEGEGGGVHVMLREAHRQGLPEPDLIDSGIQFTVKMWRANSRVSSKADEISVANQKSSLAFAQPISEDRLRLLGKNVPAVAHQLTKPVQPHSVKEIANNAGLSISQARYALNSLIEAGLVSMEGSRGSRSTTYVWVNS